MLPARRCRVGGYVVWTAVERPVCALQRVDKALLGGAAGFVPLKDAGVVEHVPKHHADLLVQDIDGVVRRKLVGAAGIDILGPRGMAAAKVVALERTGEIVAGIGLAASRCSRTAPSSGTKRGGKIARPMTSISRCSPS